jgi:hypothetical protein
MTTRPALTAPYRRTTLRSAYPKRPEILAILADARMRIDRINGANA